MDALSSRPAAGLACAKYLEHGQRQGARPDQVSQQPRQVAPPPQGVAGLRLSLSQGVASLRRLPAVVQRLPLAPAAVSSGVCV